MHICVFFKIQIFLYLWEGTLSYGLNFYQINFSSNDDGLSLYDSGHRFEHVHLLLVLLRSLPYASRTFQVRALQVHFWAFNVIFVKSFFLMVWYAFGFIHKVPNAEILNKCILWQVLIIGLNFIFTFFLSCFSIAYFLS